MHAEAPQVPLLAAVPFALMLAAIAVMPLFFQHFWERNRNKLIVSVVLGAPVSWHLLLSGLGGHLWHTMVFDYVPFVILLGALFVITGGISVTGDIEARPAVNTAFLALGAVLASFMGTTGAAMLLIRPLLQTNRERELKVHTVLFFIGIVANCGGLLTPLGDPPLFMLYLRGVPFFWFLRLWPEWLFVNSLLLAAYFAVDSYFYPRESVAAIVRDETEIRPIRVEGARNLVFLLGVVLAVAFLNGQYVEAIRAHAALGFVREAAIVFFACLAYATTSREIREWNNFTWEPIVEVAYLFLGIFVTMVPCLLYLEANAAALGISGAVQFYYASGLLSSVLDNTPTAVTFYSLAAALHRDGVGLVASVPEGVLAGIATGAVFFGSMTYIGNGPNFMVKAIAEQEGVRMPHFFRYVLIFALPVLLPVFVLVQVLLF